MHHTRLTSDSPVTYLHSSAPPGPGSDVDLGILTRAFAEQVGADTAVLTVWDRGEELGRVRATWGLSPEAAAVRVRRGDGAAGRILERLEASTFAVVPGRDDEIGALPGEGRITAFAGAPVNSPAGTAGALCAGFTGPFGVVRDRLLWLAESYAAMAALCLDGPGLLPALIDAAHHDSLTRCLNYGALHEALGHEIKRCERHGHDLACCFVDLDDFKRINDTLGHLQGNRALSTVAAALRDGIRSFDLVARFGGDEFVLVLPETDERVARKLAHRLLVAIGEATSSAIGARIQASVGVAEWTPGCSAEGLLSCADDALRIAKEAGGGAITSPGAVETPRLAARDSHEDSHRLPAVRGLPTNQGAPT